MRRNGGKSGGALFAALLLAVLSLPSAQVQAADPVGTVVTVSGGALLRSGAGDPSRGIRPVRVNDRIFAGDVINTASNGKVKILLIDKTILDIASSSLFNVKKFEGSGPSRKVELELPYGKVRAAVTQAVGGEGSMRLRTSAATMGVRGTEFVVNSDLDRSPDGNPPNSTVTVVQGKVEVAPQVAPAAAGDSGARAPASASPVMLTAGTQLMASSAPMGGGASAPTALSTDQLRTVTSTSRMADNTFEKAVVLDLTGERSAEQKRLEGNTSGSEKSGDSKGSSKEGSNGGGAKETASSDSGSSSSGGESAESGGDQGAGREPASSGEGSSAEGSSSGEGTATAESGSGGSDSAGSASDSGGGAAESTATASTSGASDSGSSSGSSSDSGGGVANFTASLITSTVEAPPPTVAAIVMPAAVVSQATSASTGGGGFSGAISSSSGITAPPAAIQEVGGYKRILINIRY